MPITVSIDEASAKRTIYRLEQLVDRLNTLTERRKIARSAVPVIRSATRSQTPIRDYGPDPKQHYRRGDAVESYSRKNTWRSIQRMLRRDFRKSPFEWVGPKVLKEVNYSSTYGKTISTATSYYSSMIYGNQRRWQQLVLQPAINSVKAVATTIMVKRAEQLFKDKKRKLGFV